MVSYRFIQPEDVEEVLAIVPRATDIEEMENLLGLPYKLDIERSIRISPFIWVVLYNGKIEAVIGYAENNNIGIPWSFASEKFPEFKIGFCKIAKEIVSLMDLVYPFQGNLVGATNHDSIRWLQWLGFTVDIPEYSIYNPNYKYRAFHRGVPRA